MSPRTYRRWLRGEYPAPVSALRLIRLAGTGDLGEIHRDWRGWTLSLRGELCSPYGLIFRPGDLNAEPMFQRLYDELRRERDTRQGQRARYRYRFPREGDAAGWHAARVIASPAAPVLPPTAGAAPIPTDPRGTETARSRSTQTPGHQDGGPESNPL